MPVKVCICLFLVSFSADCLSAESWSAWRGDIRGTGRISGRDLPEKWGKELNVKWRVDLPGPSNSTPAVWENRVFVTQSDQSRGTRDLYCFDRSDGTLLWKQGLIFKQKERTHGSNYYCSASPAVDAGRVVVSFGSGGMMCFDHEGKELWRRDLGGIDHVWGNSSSPLIFDDLVIYYHGPSKNAVFYGLEKSTGKTVWKWKEPVWKPGARSDGFRKRPGGGVIGSFSTPILVTIDDRTELIMSFPLELKAFDPETGKELWTCGGLNPLVYTSPVYDDGVVVAMGGYYGSSIGVKVGGSGDVTKTHRLWQEIRHNGGIGSGVAREGKLYYQDAGGIAFCDDMKTGKTIWKARLPGSGKSWGSFVLVGDWIYTLSQAGDSVIFKASPDGLEMLSQAAVEEETNSSLVIVDGEIFIRTHEGLWCIRK